MIIWLRILQVLVGGVIALQWGLLAPAAGATIEWRKLAPLPDSAGLGSPYAGVNRGVLLVAGGANFPQAAPWAGGQKVWHDTIYALSDLGGEWKAVGTLPRPLGYGVSATTPLGVICAGGSDARQHYRDVFTLEWNGVKVAVKTLPSLPRPMANGSGTLLENTFYLAGGIETPDATATMRTFWALDLATTPPSWRELEPWPGPARMLAVAAAQDGAFYLVSGTDLSADAAGKPVRHYLRDVYRYRPGVGWNRMADLPRAAVAAPSPAPQWGQSHFLVISGDDGTRVGFKPPQSHPGFARDVLAYHTITDTWTPLGEVTETQVTVPAVAWRSVHVLASGEIRPGVRTPEVWTLSPAQSRVSFGWINYVVVGLYLGGTLWLGASFTQRNKTTNDYFRGGQRVPWWAAGLSIFATLLSSITFMAVPAQSYSVGWNLLLGNSCLLLTPLVIAVYLPFYRSLNVTSAYEYLERRFNVATRLLASALFILFQFGRVAVVLLLPALALATVSSLNVDICILAVGILCVIYAVLGGMEAVVWTDVAQTLVLLGGAFWALVTIIARVDGGLGAIAATAAAHERFFESVSWGWDCTVGTGWLIVFGSLFTYLFSYTASQDVVQRYLTTVNERAAARALWTNTAVSLVAPILFFGIGTALFVYYRQHPERLDPTLQTDAIFPLFIVRELPAGVAGLVVAGIFAAAQSTLASSLNSVATAYVTDFHRRFRPTTTDAACLRCARLVTAGVGVAGVAMALGLAHSSIRSLWETFIAVVGLFGGTVSGLFVLGIFSERASGRGATIGALFSAMLVLAVSQFTRAHFFCYAIVGVISCVVAGYIASLLSPAPAQDLTGLTYTHRIRRTASDTSTPVASSHL